MPRLFCFVFLASYCCLGNTQTQSLLGFDLNVLQNPTNFTYLDETDNFVQTFDTRAYVGLGVSFQQKKPNQVFQEYSLVNFHYQQDDERRSAITNPTDPAFGKRQNLFNLRLRFEHGKYFLRTVDERLKAGASVAIDPSIAHVNMLPMVASEFPLTASRFAADLMLIPRIEFGFHERVSVLLKAPLSLASLAHERTTIDNPSRTIDERQINDTEINLGIGDYQVGLGVRIKL